MVESDTKALQQEVTDLLTFFSTATEPHPLYDINHVMSSTAHFMAARLPATDELVAGLRHLLEAKDAFDRAALSLPKS